MSRFLLKAEACPDCGAMRLGGEYTDDGRLTPHGVTAAGEAARATYPGPWPTAGTATRGARTAGVAPWPPACCAHPVAALLASMPVPHESPRCCPPHAAPRPRG